MEQDKLIIIIEEIRYRAKEEDLDASEALDYLLEEIDTYFNEW